MHRARKLFGSFVSVAKKPRYMVAFGLGGWYANKKWCEQRGSPAGRYVLITGCDTGFGHALACTLDKAGMKVFAGCLDATGAGAQKLKRDSSGNLTVLQLNVCIEGEINSCRDVVADAVGDDGLWGVVNNAGVCYLADIELTPASIFRKSMDVNFIGCVNISQAFLPLVERAEGRIVNMSSLTGRVPMEGYGAYSSSKAAIEAYSDVLRLEMEKWKVNVSIIEPAGFHTEAVSPATVQTRKQEIWSHLDDATKARYGESYMETLYDNFEKSIPSYEKDLGPVVEATSLALLARKPRARYVVGKGAAFLVKLVGVLPQGLEDKLVRSLGFGVKCDNTENI